MPSRPGPSIPTGLDQHVRRFLDTMAAGSARPLSVVERRDALRTLTRFASGAPVAADVAALGLPLPGGPTAARVYAPPGEEGPGPGLVFFHGGGLVSGDLDTHDAICRRICVSARVRVVAVAYRLAPEHPFPAALEDALAAIAAVAAAAGGLGIDPARLAVGGDSVGAGLAARVCQESRSHGPTIAAQLLICPVLDLTGTSLSFEAFATGFFLDAAAIRQDIAACGVAGFVASPRVSPLREADLSGLPPAFIHTAAFDMMRDDGAAYASRLAAAGVPVWHTCHPGMIHFFYGLGRIVPASEIILADIGASFGALLRGEVPRAAPDPATPHPMETVMTVRSTLLAEIETITRESNRTMPPLTDDLVLVDTEFDSLCFALLVARMEDRAGLDPFSTVEVADLPVTLGDLVALYESATPAAAA